LDIRQETNSGNKEISMKRNAGFTLIELIIVIVILGILAVVAAPKFINMQSDAKAAVVQGMKGSMSAASQMVYSKSIINGTDKKASTTLALSDGTSVATVYGYPAASATGIFNALNVVATKNSSTADWGYGTGSVPDAVGSSTTVSGFIMWPKGVATSGTAAVTAACYVGYAPAKTTAATGTASATYTAPVITIVTTGC